MSEPLEPERLGDERSPLGDLLRAARVDVVDEAALRGARAALLGAGAAASTSVAAKSGLRALWVKVAGVVALSAAVGVGWLALRPQSSSTSTAPTASPTTSSAIVAPTSDDSATPIASAPPPSIVAVPTSAAQAPPAPPKSAASPSTSAAPNDGALLLEARRALNGSPSEALALTQQHAKLFPKSALSAERESIAIDALSRLGRCKEAASRADRFLVAFPGSPHRTLVESSRARCPVE
jgi:hypothetical protein